MELIEDLPGGRDHQVSIPRENLRICAPGPHILYTKGVKAFKLTSIRGSLLERQREEQDAHPNLRNSLYEQGAIWKII